MGQNPVRISNARLYDPTTGMFTTADTIVPNFANPQSFNRYAYTRNPMRYIDPTGHEESDYTFNDFVNDVGNFLNDPIGYVVGTVGGWFSDDPGGGYSDYSPPPLYDSGWLSGAETPNYVQPIADNGGGVNTNLPSAWNTVSNFIFGADTYSYNDSGMGANPSGLYGQNASGNGQIIVAWNYASEYGTTGQGLQPSMTNIENTVDSVFNDVAGRDATVTYTTNGQHSPNSQHYTGNAVDLRTRDMTPAQIQDATQQLRRALDVNNTILNEGDHIHVQTRRK